MYAWRSLLRSLRSETEVLWSQTVYPHLSFPYSAFSFSWKAGLPLLYDILLCSNKWNLLGVGEIGNSHQSPPTSKVHFLCPNVLRSSLDSALLFPVFSLSTFLRSSMLNLGQLVANSTLWCQEGLICQTTNKISNNIPQQIGRGCLNMRPSNMKGKFCGETN